MALAMSFNRFLFFFFLVEVILGFELMLARQALLLLEPPASLAMVSD
jgi:hypothetical protein